MNQKTFTLIISKVNQLLFSGEAISVTVPSADGVLTLLAGHEPLITTLKSGTIRVTTPLEKKEFVIEKGVLETSHGQITILV